MAGYWVDMEREMAEFYERESMSDDFRIKLLRSLVDQLRSALRSIISHWDEFGPEHGFGETIDSARHLAMDDQENQT